MTVIRTKLYRYIAVINKSLEFLDIMKSDTFIAPLPEKWKSILKPVIYSEKFNSLLKWLETEKEKEIIYPPIANIFKTYQTLAIEDIKVVILGQDPYHGEGQAQGLSFSVPNGVLHPPSLRNIFKELDTDVDCNAPNKFIGDLSAWNNQGVFLLNAVLTVTKAKPNSHKDKGWEEFTDATIQAISDYNTHVVFVLWGNYAKKKAPLIDANKHLILTRHGFFGSKPFSAINKYLTQTNQSPIDWQITE